MTTLTTTTSRVECINKMIVVCDIECFVAFRSENWEEFIAVCVDCALENGDKLFLFYI